MNNEYKNPYINCAETEESRKLTAVIPRSVYAFIKGIRPEDGTVQTTLNLLIEHLIYALKQRNITAYTDRKQFEFFVANCVFILPGEPGESCSKFERDQGGGEPPSVPVSNPPAPSPLRGVKEEGGRMANIGVKCSQPPCPPRQDGNGGGSSGATKAKKK
jgi:hypothetical protein